LSRLAQAPVVQTRLGAAQAPVLLTRPGAAQAPVVETRLGASKTSVVHTSPSAAQASVDVDTSKVTKGLCIVYCRQTRPGAAQDLVV
jgi:hypothetical protein